jgi:hypothetical protein
VWSSTKPGSKAAGYVLWTSVGSLGRRSRVDAADSDAGRCLAPGLEVEGPGLELGRSRIRRLLLRPFLAWPPRVGGVGSDFGGTSVLRLFSRCHCGRRLLQQRRGFRFVEWCCISPWAPSRSVGRWWAEKLDRVVARAKARCIRFFNASLCYSGVKDRWWVGKLSRIRLLKTS